MTPFVEKYPLLFPLYFICLWVGISLFSSFIGGWRKLASVYKVYNEFNGTKWCFQSAQFNKLANYGGLLTFGVDGESLFLAVFFIFRIGHPALLIPLNEITGKEMQKKWWNSGYVELTFKQKDITVRIDKKLADKIEEAGIGRWKYERYDK